MNENILDVTIAPECPHKGCGKIFNESNLRLAIYLNGIFFLVKPEKGIIGFTCPKCKKTIVKQASYNDTLKIRDRFSNSPVEIVSCSKSEEGKDLVYPKNSFDPTLNYFSPFMLSSEIIGKFGIDYFQPPHQDYSVLSDTITNHLEKNPELKDKYCSFAGDASNAQSQFRAVYWFDDTATIEACVKYEIKHNVRIFPRYHYSTDLIEQVNSLLGINYFMGKTYAQAKIDHEREHAQTIETLKTVAYEKNLNFDKFLEENNISQYPPLTHIIEQNQEGALNDPAIPARFFSVLTSNPYPLGDLLNTEICNYLWAEINPFEHRAFPEFFVNELDDPDLGLQIHEKNEKHITMAKLVQEHSNKQYVQDFLRDNVVSFLEQYEKLIQSNKFAYADVWELKENFLVRLYKETSIQAKQEIPYSMGLAGEIWIIKFGDQKARFYPNEVGFLWIYNILKNPATPVYYSWLEDNFGKKACITEYGLEALTDGDNTSDNDGNDLFDKKIIDGMVFGDRLTTTHSGIVSEQKYVDNATLSQLQTIVDGKIKAREQSRSKGDSTGYQHHEDGLNALLKYLERKIGVFTKECKPEEGFIKLQARKFKDGRYKKAATRIKKNYADAMKKIKNNDPALHQHFLDYIKKQGGAFIYSPSEDITWHLD